jgi:hypothetical protein
LFLSCVYYTLWRGVCQSFSRKTSRIITERDL